MINLEVWIPSMYDFTSDLVPHCFLECGAIRNPGYFGWFVPKETLKPLSHYYRRKEVEDVHYSEFRNTTFASLFDITNRALLSEMQSLAKELNDAG